MSKYIYMVKYCLQIVVYRVSMYFYNHLSNGFSRFFIEKVQITNK